MPIDPRISLGVQPIQLADPIARYGQLATIQNAQNQNALAQYQLSTAQREQETVNALNEAYAKAYDAATGKINRNTLRESLARGGFGSKLPGIEKTLIELDKEATLLEKTQGEVKAQPVALAKGQTELLDAKLKQSRSFLDTLNPADPNAAAQYIRWHEANHADPIIGPALKAQGITVEQSRAKIEAAIKQGPQAFADLINGSKLGTEKFMELNKPTVTAQNTGGTARMLQTPGLGGAATMVPGSEATITMNENQKQEIKLSQARLSEEQKRVALEARRVKIAEEQAKNEKDPVFQQTMAQARATGQAISKDKALAEQVLPKVLSTAESTLSLIDGLVGTAPVLDSKGKVIKHGTKPHPGFETAVGASLLPGARLIPGTDAADFQSRFEQVKGGAFLQAFETLKGGGSITNIEGEKGTSALNRMSLAQSEKEFTTAAREFQDIVRKGVERAKKRVGGGVSTVNSTTGVVDNSNPLLMGQ
jgi:hypothetical protein